MHQASARFFVGFAFIVCGCSELPTRTAISVRDSAGVEIVEHAPGVDAQVPVWRVAELPDLTIGAAAGDSQDLLFNVEGAHVLPNGRDYVLGVTRDEHDVEYVRRFQVYRD